MKKTILLLLLAFIGWSTANAQIGIGTTTPDRSAELDVTSPANDKGFLPPRMTTAQRDLINNPATGLMLYNTDVPCLQVNDGTPAAPIWNCVSGPAGVDPSTDTDGDGVPDITDSDPSDPCLPAQAPGYTGFDSTNTIWRAADCDGDGDTNGTEADCGSDPYDAGDVCPILFPNICDPANPTAVVEVNAGGHTWMDRNLGASRAAQSSTDFEAYGDLYQWGRGNDGHQCINWVSSTASDGTEQSNESSSQSNLPNPGSTFIIGFNNWYNGTNPNDLWKPDLSGVNNPCPAGYRVPSETELADLGITNASDAYSSIGLPMAGYRGYSNGSLGTGGTRGDYWSSTVSSSNSRTLTFNSSNAFVGTSFRANGFSVRCLKD